MRRTSATIARLLVLLLWWQPAAAVELGNPEVESNPGQILDIRIPLLDPGNTAELRLIPHDAALYGKAGFEYGGLHERIIVELVTTVERPYIAVSSIGAVGQKHFDLVVGVAVKGGDIVRNYSITLAQPAPPPPPVQKPLSAPELLSQLLDRIAAATGLSRVAVLDGLWRLVEGSADDGRHSVVFRLGGGAPDAKFTGGFRQLLGTDAGAAFDRDVQAHGAAHAVAAALFEDPGYAALRNLLKNAAVSTSGDGGSVGQRLAFMKEKVAVLEIQIAEIKRLAERRRNPPPEDDRAEPGLVDQLRAFGARHGWDERTLLTRPVWIGVAVFWGVLLVLMLVRLYRRMRAARLTRRPARRRRPPLPGQHELEKEFGSLAAPRGAAGGAPDDVANQLSLAVTYIEMGDYVKAEAALDAAIACGNEEQIGRARRLKGKIKGKFR